MGAFARVLRTRAHATSEMKTFSDISLISVWGLLGCSYAVYLYILLRRGIKNHLKSTILNFIWGSAAGSAWRSFKNRPRTTPSLYEEAPKSVQNGRFLKENEHLKIVENFQEFNKNGRRHEKLEKYPFCIGGVSKFIENRPFLIPSGVCCGVCLEIA